MASGILVSNCNFASFDRTTLIISNSLDPAFDDLDRMFTNIPTKEFAPVRIKLAVLTRSHAS